MSRNTAFARWGVATLLASVLLGGCVVVPARPYDGGYGAYGGEYVAVAPPAPRVEIEGVAPMPGLFWIAGYWAWAGGRHEWVPGRWESARPGYHWVPHAWAHEDRGWRMHEGHWDRRD